MAANMPISPTNALPRDASARLAEYIAVARNWRRRQPISIVYHSEWTIHFHLRRLLAAAEFLDQGDVVARHLLGATLQYRFPEICALNEPLSAKPLPTERDFLIGDTAFRVAIAPGDADIEKCHDDLRAGLCVYLLVSDGMLMGIQQKVARIRKPRNAADRIVVESVESFISTMIECLSAFDGHVVNRVFASIIDLYNQRLGLIDASPSLRIQLNRTSE